MNNREIQKILNNAKSVEEVKIAINKLKAEAKAKALAKAKVLEAKKTAKSVRDDALRGAVVMFGIDEFEYKDGKFFNITFEKGVEGVSENDLNKFFNGLVAGIEALDLKMKEKSRREKANK